MDWRWATDNGPSQKLILSTLCSGELKIRKTQKIVFSKCLLRHDVLHVFCRTMCWYLYGPFCHGLHCLQHSFFKHLFNLYSPCLCCFSARLRRKLHEQPGYNYQSELSADISIKPVMFVQYYRTSGKSLSVFWTI